MKIVALLRVSPDKQAEQGLGLDLQRDATAKWAKVNGHKIVCPQSDEGVSGSHGLDKRDGLAEALRLIRCNQADAITVYRLDRLARDLVLQEQLLSEIRRAGGEVFTTSAAEAGYLADDPDDPSRRLIRQVLGAVNEYERGMIKLRMVAGRRRKAEQGGYAYGSPAYGYRAEGKTLVACESEWLTLGRIRELHQGGHSLRSIAATLAGEGHRPKRGTSWHPESLRRVIARCNETPGEHMVQNGLLESTIEG